MSRGWKDLNIDGLIIQSTESKRADFYRMTGLDRKTDLSKLKAGHRKKVMEAVQKLWPDQYPEDFDQ